MISAPNIQVTAGGNITPFRVVKLSTVADNQILISAAATSANIGIAQGGTRRAPGTGDDDGFAAISGETCMIWGVGCVALGEAGGTVTRGDKVTSDSAGRLVTTTSTGDVVVGWAMQSAATNDLIEILVQPFVL